MRTRFSNALVFAAAAAFGTLPLGGCWEWDIFVPEDPNVCGTHIPPVTGTLTVVNFSLIDVGTKAEVPGFDPIAADATLDLTLLPGRLNVRANTAPPVVGGVAFELDGVSAAFEFAPPYMLAGDNCGAEYRVWQTPPRGVHILTGTALRGATADSGRGGASTLTFTIN